MKILSTKEYNKLMKMKSDYLDLLWKPFQGVFEKVTDDDLLRENGLLNAENERLNNIINKAIEYIEKQKPLSVDETRQKEQLKLAYKNSDIFKTLCHLEDLEIAIWELKDILKGVDKE